MNAPFYTKLGVREIEGAKRLLSACKFISKYYGEKPFNLINEAKYLLSLAGREKSNKPEIEKISNELASI